MANTKMLGFDIGSYRMKIVESDSGRIRRTVTVDLPDNIVRDGRIIAYSAMADFIKETVRRNKLKYRDVSMSISAENYYIRQVTLPIMTTALLDVNLPFEFHDYINGDLSKYVYDYAVLSMDDKNMKLIAAAFSKDLLNNFRVMMKRAGLHLVKVVPDVLALATILYHQERIVDPSKSKAELAAMRRDVDRKINAERAEAEKILRQRETAEKKAEQDKKKAAHELEKSGFILDDDDTLDSLDAGDVRDDNNSGAEGAVTSDDAHVPVENGNNNAGVKANEERGKDYVVLDIGFRNAELHFFSNKTFEITRTMEEGEKKIAQYIVDEHGVDIHIAMIQLEHDQNGVLSEQGVLDQFDALATEVMRVMNFYSYNNPQNNIDRIYYFGGGSEIPQLLKMISQTTELPMSPLTDLIPGLTDEQRNDLEFGPQSFGAVIE